MAKTFLTLTVSRHEPHIMIKRSAFLFNSLITAGLVCGWVGIALSAGVSLPTEERFVAPKLGSAWVEEVSTGTKLDLKDDGLHFNGPAHGLGHVQREAGMDLITVSARIAQWGSVYLVWNENSWCGAGQISPTPFGRLYSTAVEKGEADEEDHRGIDFGLERWVRIELGQNFIRFSHSNEGKQWAELRTIARPRAFAGAPK